MSAVIRTEQLPTPVPAREYRLHAYSGPAQLTYETIRAAFPQSLERLERFNRDCVLLRRYEHEVVFIFRFGTVVFFNVPISEHEYYLSKLGISNSSRQRNTGSLTEDDFVLRVEGSVSKVSFNAVTLPDLDVARLQIVAQVLAQSSSLELIEHEVEQFLAESEKMSELLRRRTMSFNKRDKLLQFIGEGLNARHRIVTQLSLLNEPDKAWEREELYTLFKDLFENFDVEDRIEKIDRMFQLSAQVSELLLEMVNQRRAEILELIIIALIGVEIVKSFLGG